MMRNSKNFHVLQINYTIVIFYKINKTRFYKTNYAVEYTAKRKCKRCMQLYEQYEIIRTDYHGRAFNVLKDNI